MKIYYTTLLFCFSFFVANAQTNYTISGYVREKGSRESLIGANLYIPSLKSGASANNYGFYSVTIPATDSLFVVVSFVGYKTLLFKFSHQADREFNIDMEADGLLDEVVVEADKEYEMVSEKVQMSSMQLPVQQVRDIPALLSEKDVLKVLQLMPGVQKGSEGNGGLYVRGGGPDQNLIILDDATVYNAYHLFGFFSLFNGDAIRGIELTKGGFPARYGGRLSSVIDITMKDGDKERVKGEIGMGLIASKLTLEGPIKKNKSSFMVSGRRTYIDIPLRLFLPKDRQAGYYFYDLNAKANYEFGQRDKLYVSGYFGKDNFYADFKDQDNDSKSSINWGNATASVRWNHLFSQKLFANTSFVFSNYQFVISIDSKSNSQQFLARYQSGIRDYAAKFNVDYLPRLNHSIKAGVSMINHVFTPKAITVKTGDPNSNIDELQEIQSLEGGLYAEDDFRLGTRWHINAGARLSMFTTEGKTYFRGEPRVAVAFKLKEGLSAKLSYAQMNQYIHLLSNTGIGLPTDLWVPSTSRVKPQSSEQVAIGLAKDIPSRNLTVTLEGYYKESTSIIGYKEGASYLGLDEPGAAKDISWEDNVTAGKGRSYGAELFIQRKMGKFSGWIGYTLSWTQVQFDEVNFGKEFFPRYDRRHDISVVAIYKPRPRITLSGTWVYGTGNALSLPTSTFTLINHQVGQYSYSPEGKDYGQKNSFRAAPYHRFDIGIQFHRKLNKGERTWEFSVYNAYNRANPFFYDISTNYDPKTQTETNVLKQYSLFPIIPSFTWRRTF
jgi:TonB dependent receptor/CarboxypepD_reg-like domain/TonB-dependent Receptor Plug Domain